jgi:hypothetical protein
MQTLAHVQGVSLCLLVFNTVPHLTLLLHSAAGAGRAMVRWCRVGMALTALSAAAAIAVLWLFYPRGIDFARPFEASITFLQVRRDSQSPSACNCQRGSLAVATQPVSAVDQAQEQVSAAMHKQRPKQMTAVP